MKAVWQIFGNVAFVGKVEPRLDLRPEIDEPSPPGRDGPAEPAFSPQQRLLALTFGLGSDEVAETFDLGEIELSVFEGPAGEVAGSGQLDILDGGQGAQHRRNDGARSMDLEFGAVFAGKAVRRRKENDQSRIERSPVSAAQGPERHVPRIGN